MNNDKETNVEECARRIKEILYAKGCSISLDMDGELECVVIDNKTGGFDFLPFTNS